MNQNLKSSGQSDLQNESQLAMQNKLPQVIPNLSNIKVVCRIKKLRQAEILSQQQNNGSSSIAKTIDIQNMSMNNTNHNSSTRNTANKNSNLSFRNQPRQQLKSPSSNYKQQGIGKIQNGNRNRSLSNGNRSFSNMNKIDSKSQVSTPKRGVSQTKRHQSSLLENFEFSIFSTVEDSPFVITSEEQPIKGKVLNTFLVSQNDIQQFTNDYITSSNKAQLFIFDQVINENINSQSFYSQLARNEVHKITKQSQKLELQQSGLNKNFCFIMFGPTDSSEKNSKISQLLATKSDGLNSNVALKAVSDILTIRETYFKDHQTSLKVQILQTYLNEIHDLIIHDHQKQSFTVKINDQGQSNATQKVVRNIQDFCQLLRIAQQNRNVLSQQLKLEPFEMKNKSHLIIRLQSQNNKYDFVELCGSDLAAQSISQHILGKHIELQRKFATASFNSLSTILTKHSDRDANQNPLTNILRDTLCDSNSKIILACNISPSQHQFRHSFTALKFCSKIRDVIAKRHIKESKGLALMRNEMQTMSQKLMQNQNQNQDQLMNQFNTLRTRYEDVLSQSKSFGEVLKDHEKFLQLEKIREEFNSLKNDFNVFERNQTQEIQDRRVSDKFKENSNQDLQQVADHSIQDLQFNQVQKLDSNRRSNSKTQKQLIPHLPIQSKISHRQDQRNYPQTQRQNQNSSVKQTNNIMTPTPEFKSNSQSRNFDGASTSQQTNKNNSSKKIKNSYSQIQEQSYHENSIEDFHSKQNQPFDYDSYTQDNTHNNQHFHIESSQSKSKEQQHFTDINIYDNELSRQEQSVLIDAEEFSLNITASDNQQNSTTNMLQQYNNTANSSQNRLNNESQKLLDKYREAKKYKQEKLNSLNYGKSDSSKNLSYTQNNVSANYENINLTQKCFDNTGHQSQSQSYDMTANDDQINMLQKEIMMLKERLNEQTMETQTLKLAFRHNEHQQTLRNEIIIEDSQHYQDESNFQNFNQDHNQQQQLTSIHQYENYEQTMTSNTSQQSANMNTNIPAYNEQMVSKVQQLEAKLDQKNQQIAGMLRQKQSDSKELKELRFKLDREINNGQSLENENSELRSKLDQIQRRFIQLESKGSEQLNETQSSCGTSSSIPRSDKQHIKEQMKKALERGRSNERVFLNSVQQVDEMRSEMYDLKLEVETIKRQKNILQSQYDEIVQQVQELETCLTQKDQTIYVLDLELTTIKAKEFDKVGMIQKQSEVDVKILQMQYQVSQAQKDKKKAEDELFTVRDKLRMVLGEKIQIENQLNHIERVEDSRINELEASYEQLSKDYQKCIEDNKTLKSKETELKIQVQQLQRGRDSFKEQFLELREFNKDLKCRFFEIEKQVQELVLNGENEQYNQSKFSGKENNQRAENTIKRENILTDIQGLIKDYKRNAQEKKYRYSGSGPLMQQSHINNSNSGIGMPSAIIENSQQMIDSHNTSSCANQTFLNY